ncbi:MAG: beta-aspartyl-peptidase [Thermaerobacter sp.]|nr:beta-aspartyl-peptidase [Thermaerobacter sp.]
MFLLLRGADVYAPEPLGRQDVLIASGRIARIAPHISLSRRSLPDLRVHSLAGMALVPGYIDAHVHIAGGGGEGGFQHRTPPVHLEALAPHGTTRVVGLLGTDGVTRTVAELLAEARRLTALGLSASILTGAYQLPTRTLTGSVRSDLVLIPEVLGAGEIAIADDRGSHPSDRDLLEIASEVRVGALLAGKKGILHMHVGDGIRKLASLQAVLRRSALPNDLFSATHLNRNPDLLAEAPDLTHRGAYADLTAGIFPAPGDDKPVDPAEALAHLLKEGDPSRVTMSSDGNGSSPVFDDAGRLVGIGVGAPGRLHWALRRAVIEQKVPLELALPVVTRNVAAALGLEDVGRIAVGCSADLVALNVDLSVTEVFARGRLAAQRGQLRLPDPFAPSADAKGKKRVESVSDKSPAPT